MKHSVYYGATRDTGEPIATDDSHRIPVGSTSGSWGGGGHMILYSQNTQFLARILIEIGPKHAKTS